MSSYFQRLFLSGDDLFANIELDARIRENFSFSTVITDHPIDTGGVISDHAYTNPESYFLEGVVSDTPMAVSAALSQIGDNATNLWENGYVSSTGSLLNALNDPAPASKRSVAAFLSLIAFWKELTVFDVQTAMGLYKDLIIENLEAEVTERTANVLIFRATMRRVDRRNTSLLLLSNLKEGPVQQSGEAPVSEGVKQAVTSTPETVANARGLYS